MTTESSSKLINDLKSVPSPVFYIFAAVALFACFFVQGFGIPSVFTALFLLCLVACAASDINKGIVPDIIVIAIALLGLLRFAVVEGLYLPGIVPRLIGALCISAPMFLISLLIKGAFGGGDIKLMAASGLYLGWRLTLAGAFLGLFISGFYAIYLLLLRKAGSKSKIKLVPFLSIGLSAASLFGDVLLLFIFM